MGHFSFSRTDIVLYRQWRVWKRKYVRCIGRPHVTLGLLLVILVLHRIPSSSHHDANNTFVNLRKKQVNDSSSKGKQLRSEQGSPKAAVVLLAPQRYASSLWGMDRFCFLRRVIRSIDQHLNANYGPYPIIIVTAQDYAQDPNHLDGAYTIHDRALIQQWAPHSTIIWKEINLYSDDALEPDTTIPQILAWRQGKDGGQEGRTLGYQSMCRLWSGRLQNLPILNEYEYYMRLDDDSLLLSPLLFDPFLRIQESNLTYVYRRKSFDMWGIAQLWNVAQSYVLDPSLPAHTAATRNEFLTAQQSNQNNVDRSILENEAITTTIYLNGSSTYSYEGIQPYNNFHIARVDFWRSMPWKQLMKDMDTHHLFMKHRVGDANVHAMALLMMGDKYVGMWDDFPYAHNSNDMGNSWAPKEWKAECETNQARLY